MERGDATRRFVHQSIEVESDHENTYSSPPLLKKWLDDVINDDLFGGSPEKSTVLNGKTLQLAVTIGRIEPRYFPPEPDAIWADDVLIPYIKPELIEAHGDRIVDVLLAPFEQTAHLAGMQYGKPFITYNVGPLTRRGSIDEVELRQQGQRYEELVQGL